MSERGGRIGVMTLSATGRPGAKLAVDRLRKYAIGGVPTEVAEDIATLIDHAMRLEMFASLVLDAVGSAASDIPDFAVLRSRRKKP